MNPTIPGLLGRLYQRIHMQAPDESTAAQLNLIAYDDGLLDSAPNWLIELLTALAENDSFNDRRLATEQFFDRRYDVTDFLITLAPVLGFECLHDGEYMVLSFEQLSVSICFDFESGGGVGLRFMRWIGGPWPHWERWPPGDPRNRPAFTE